MCRVLQELGPSVAAPRLGSASLVVLWSSATALARGDWHGERLRDRVRLADSRGPTTMWSGLLAGERRKLDHEVVKRAADTAVLELHHAFG